MLSPPLGYTGANGKCVFDNKMMLPTTQNKLEMILRAVKMKEAPLQVFVALYKNVDNLMNVFYDYQDSREKLKLALVVATENTVVRLADICKIMGS